MTIDVRLDRLLGRRRRALADQLAGALLGDVEAVHSARVATRRLREVLPLVLAELPTRKTAKLLRQVRRFTRALGPVRELDVTAATLAACAPMTPAGGDTDALTRTLERRRHRALTRLAAKFGRTDHAPRLVAELAAAVEALAGHEGAGAWQRELRERLQARSKKLRAALEQAGALYQPERLHALRIATKQLRYAIELAAELRLSEARPLVATFKMNQDVLGRLHDLEVLAHVIRGHRKSNEQVREALVARIDHECRLLHAQFLKGRGRLIAAADAAADAVSRMPSARMTPPRKKARARRPKAATSRASRPVPHRPARRS
jgi:CHAD domain-containing protein